MARDNRKAFLAELEKISPAIRRAFEAAVQDIRSTAQIAVLEDAIKRGDIQAALRALRLDSTFWSPLDRAIEDSFRQGAVWQLSTIPKTAPSGSGGPLTIRFQGRHPRAEAWARDHAAALITRINEGQRLAVQDTLVAGLEDSLPPRRLALDIVGRMDGNQRTGGIIGLTRGQAGYVTNMRRELADPEIMAGYFNKTKRDRRLDPIVNAAIKAGKPVARGDIDRIAGRYSDRLLKVRGDMVARTETLASMNAGRDEAARQMIESGKVPADAVTKIWDATISERTRDTHLALNGTEVRFDAPFVSPSGALMKYPGDVELGAGGEETINCRCTHRIRVDYTKVYQ